jgi:hypothetical protein
VNAPFEARAGAAGVRGTEARIAAKALIVNGVEAIFRVVTVEAQDGVAAAGEEAARDRAERVHRGVE